MKALTVRQPWAQLLVTTVPTTTTAEFVQFGTRRTVKWIETRTRWAPASALGQRIAITASAYRPWTDRDDGGTRAAKMMTEVPHATGTAMRAAGIDMPLLWSSRLPRGVVVGSGVLTASVPMVADYDDACSAYEGPAALEITPSGMLALYPAWAGALDDDDIRDVSDQQPFGDFTPGRWAWLLDDLAPITERCPACWGDGWKAGVRRDEWGGADKACPVCNGVGRLGAWEGVPVKGRLGVWEWTL